MRNLLIAENAPADIGNNIADTERISEPLTSGAFDSVVPDSRLRPLAKSVKAIHMVAIGVPELNSAKADLHRAIRKMGDQNPQEPFVATVIALTYPDELAFRDLQTPFPLGECIARSKRTPRAAIRSMFGVTARESSYAPSACWQ